LGVLASGRGSILAAILDAGLAVEAVILDRPCPAAQLAEQTGVVVEIVAREPISSAWPTPTGSSMR
jgi:folate-dependent phosphoribosylglycinamide formyltransferase PurN